MTQDLGRVAVIFGGTSSERDVSLMSGSGVLEALQGAGVNAFAFDPKTDDFSALKAKADRAFIAMHGKMGEDGNLQGVLNYLGLPYTGPGVKASAVAMDKEMTKVVWKAAGLPVPEGREVLADVTDDVLTEILESLGQNGLVVKPARDGSSIGVTKLPTPTLEGLKAGVVAATAKGDPALIEAYIHGREFTVAILDGKALPVIEIKAPEGDYDFENKYFGDAVSYECPAQLTNDETTTMQTLCERAFAALGCRGWSRVDVMQKPDGSFVLLEINTSPGMTPHSLVPMAARAVGLDYAALCQTVLGLAATD